MEWWATSASMAHSSMTTRVWAIPAPRSNQGTAAGPATGRKNNAAAVNSSTARHSPEKLMSRPRMSTHHSMAAARTISTPWCTTVSATKGTGSDCTGTPFTAPMAKL